MVTRSHPFEIRYNCVNCAVALNATLRGSRASALLGESVQINQIPGIFGRSRFDAVFSTINGVLDAMAAEGTGARAVVVGVGPTRAHAFNAVNQRGIVQLLDGQSGGSPSLDGLSRFYLLRNP